MWVEESEKTVTCSWFQQSSHYPYTPGGKIHSNNLQRLKQKLDVKGRDRIGFSDSGVNGIIV